MDELIKQLKLAREQYSQAQEETAKILAKLQQTKLWQEYEEAKRDEDGTKLLLTRADENLRNKALFEYFLTGNKKPADGVSIIIGKNLNYNPTEATAWAKEHQPDLIELNEKKFEKYARAILDVTPLEFVTVEEVPSVRIAKDL